MDVAREAKTLTPVEAIELWTISDVDRDGYICRWCKTKVKPASFNKKINKLRPYFSLCKNHKHEFGCAIKNATEIVKQAKKKRVGTPLGFPLPFPNKLVLAEESKEGSADKAKPSSSTNPNTRSLGGTPDSARMHHGHTVKTIRTICRTFIEFPVDREFMSLTIPGVPGDFYAKVFWKLGSKKPKPLLQPKHLYYAPIRWTISPVIIDTYCEITLHAGEWDAEQNLFKSFCRVRVNWTEWSKARRDSLADEYYVTSEEAKEGYKTDNATKGWLFFVGTQDTADPSLFHVDDHRLICCLPAVIDWPSRN